MQKYIIRLSNAVEINGCVVGLIGPFNSIREACEWSAKHDGELNRKGVRQVTAETVFHPSQID